MSASELLPLISPKLHPKYSPNLYAWLKSNFGNDASPLVATRDGDGLRYIGVMRDNGWMSGALLNAVLCNGRHTRTWAIYKPTLAPEFWRHYARDGRCAIDTTHTTSFIGDESRWHEAQGGKVRECLWCGHHTQVKLTWAETVHKHAWVPA